MNHHQANEWASCPFCGCKNMSVFERDQMHFVMCLNCTGEGPSIEGAGSSENAIKEWNRRAAPTSEPAVDRDAVQARRSIASIRRIVDASSDETIGLLIDDDINRLTTYLAAPAAPAVPDDSSMPVDMSQAKRWIVQLRGRVDSLLAIINEKAPAVPAAPPVASDVSVANYDEAVHQVFDTTCNAWEDVSIEQWMRCNASYRRVLYASPQPSGNPGEFPQSAPPSPSVDQAKRLVGGEVAAMVCGKCGVDRSKAPCKREHWMSCGMEGIASTGSATSTADGEA